MYPLANFRVLFFGSKYVEKCSLLSKKVSLSVSPHRGTRSTIHDVENYDDYTTISFAHYLHIMFIVSVL